MTATESAIKIGARAAEPRPDERDDALEGCAKPQQEVYLAAC